MQCAKQHDAALRRVCGPCTPYDALPLLALAAMTTSARQRSTECACSRLDAGMQARNGCLVDDMIRRLDTDFLLFLKPRRIHTCKEPRPHRSSCTTQVCTRTISGAPPPPALPLPPVAILARAAALADTPGSVGDASSVLSGRPPSPPPPPPFWGFWGVPSRLVPVLEVPTSPALAAVADRGCLCAAQGPRRASHGGGGVLSPDVAHHQ